MYHSPCIIRIEFFHNIWVINSNLFKWMSNFPSDEYRWKWKKQNGLELGSGLAIIWSKLTSFLLCCSAVRMWLRCILWLGTMWQYWTVMILPLLSTGKWQILTLLIQGKTIQRNVSCSYEARVDALPYLLACLRSSVVTIIVTAVATGSKTGVTTNGEGSEGVSTKTPLW
jgi:hypothetical protein